MKENTFFESVENVLNRFEGARLCRCFSSKDYLCVAIPGRAVYRERLFMEIRKFGFSLYNVGACGSELVCDFCVL